MDEYKLPHLGLVGMKCGAKRWPNFGYHPECWGKPWQGIVLAINNPVACEGTLAFGADIPAQAAVDAQIKRVHEMYAAAVPLRGERPFTDKAPVMWEFGKVLWDSVWDIRPYAEDLADWRRQRACRLEGHSQHLSVPNAA